MAKKKEDVVKKKRSEIIGDFVKLLEESTSKYNFNYDEVHTKELLATDIEHKFELQNLTYHQKAKLADQLVMCQRERRTFKDEVEELEPLMQWMSDNKNMYNSITKLLGEVKKAEKKHESRGYVPRVMTQSEWGDEK